MGWSNMRHCMVGDIVGLASPPLTCVPIKQFVDAWGDPVTRIVGDGRYANITISRWPDQQRMRVKLEIARNDRLYAA